VKTSDQAEAQPRGHFWRDLMKRTFAPLTIAIANATILAMPLSGLAQTPQQTPPPTPSQPEQPATPAPAQSDATKDAAKAHLTAARNALSQITQMPAAGQLQGETRAQVSALISNFNELITTKTDWKTSFSKVESNVDALLTGSGTAEPGKPIAAGELDPGIRGKLVEFREHLTKFEQAATGAPSDAAAAPPTPDAPPPTTQTPPNQPQPPANQPQLPPTQPEPTTPPEQDDRSTADPEEALRHIEAIEAIVGAQAAAQAAQSSQNPIGTTGTPSGSTRTTVSGRDIMLTPEQVQQLRTHLAELRRLIAR
jgi:hypothetical protein